MVLLHSPVLCVAGVPNEPWRRPLSGPPGPSGAPAPAGLSGSALLEVLLPPWGLGVQVPSVLITTALIKG